MSNRIEFKEGQDVYVRTHYDAFHRGRVIKITPSGKVDVQLFRTDGTEIPGPYRFGKDGYREGAHLDSYKWRRDHLDDQMTFEQRTAHLERQAQTSRVILMLDKLTEGRRVSRSASKETILEHIALWREALDEVEEAANAIGVPEPTPVVEETVGV